jgi:hypothetical protein
MQLCNCACAAVTGGFFSVVERRLAASMCVGSDFRPPHGVSGSSTGNDDNFVQFSAIGNNADGRSVTIPHYRFLVLPVPVQTHLLLETEIYSMREFLVSVKMIRPRFLHE